jgi:hypothetical protein
MLFPGGDKFISPLSGPVSQAQNQIMEACHPYTEFSFQRFVLGQLAVVKVWKESRK